MNRFISLSFEHPNVLEFSLTVLFSEDRYPSGVALMFENVSHKSCFNFEGRKLKSVMVNEMMRNNACKKDRRGAPPLPVACLYKFDNIPNFLESPLSFPSNHKNHICKFCLCEVQQYEQSANLKISFLLERLRNELNTFTDFGVASHYG